MRMYCPKSDLLTGLSAVQPQRTQPKQHAKQTPVQVNRGRQFPFSELWLIEKEQDKVLTL